MQTLQELLVELWFLGVSQEKIDQWVIQYVEEVHPIIDEEIFELLDCITVGDSENLLLSLAQKKIPNFSETSEEIENLSAKLLLKNLQSYLKEEISPNVLCRMIVNMECTFLGAPRSMPTGVAYYPEWLGDLWNACDWCEDSWTFENSPHLASKVEQQVLKIKEWLLKSKL